jgi:hypothetical protein
MGNIVKDVLTVGSVVAAPFTAGTSLAWLPSALGAGAALTGMFATNNQYGAETSNQSGELQQENSIANILKNEGLDFQPLLDAQKGGIQTFQQQAGGVPNIGAMTQSLFGDSISKALDSILSNRNAALGEAGNLYGNAASGYGSMAGRTLGAGSNLGTGLAADIAGLIPPAKSPSGTPGGTQIPPYQVSGTPGVGGDTPVPPPPNQPVISYG